ncbi:MAG: nitrate- and nitrite sensing domain-containing protein [Methylicorpusculum sp.]|nr:nitrate- and nitrite sensing domain-containing protein [Methylicorpusculum sp.]
MFSLHKLKFNFKIALIALLPLSGLLLISSFIVIHQVDEMQSAERIISLANLSVHVSDLVHELQKERGMSAGHLGSRGQKFKTELVRQRETTDARLKKLNQFLSEFDKELSREIAESMDSADRQMAGLISTRRGVSALTASGETTLAYYSNLNAAYLDIIAQLPQFSTNVHINHKLDAYANFLKGKEQAGIERAVLTNTFTRDVFGPGMYEKLVSLIAFQDTYLDLFTTVAPTEYKDFFKHTLSGKTIEETARMRRKALDKAEKGGFGVDASHWFAMQTGKIDLLKEVENFIANDAMATSTGIRQEATRQLIFNGIFIAIIGGLSFMLFWIISKDIAHQLGGEPQVVSAMTAKIAAGQLDRRTEAHSSRHVGIFAAMLTMQKRLADVIGTISTCSEQIAQASQEVNNAAHTLSQSTCEQAASIEQTSAALEQLTGTVENNHENAQITEKIAITAAATAVDGGQAVNDTVAAMEKIADKISLIEEIAYQTNLLSLNASIVAAKAGEHGASFSVVATEVRKLSTRSQETANEISTLAKNGLAIAKKAGNLLNEVLPNIQKTASLVQEIASASDTQATGVRQISQAIVQLDNVIQQNAAASEQLAATSEELNDQSQLLMGQIGFFKLQ